MKSVILGLFFVFSSSAWAAESRSESELTLTSEIADGSEVIQSLDDAKTIRVADIKSYLKTVDTNHTCMDEMLKRRTQLIVRLSVKPLTAPVGFFGLVFASGLTGSYIGSHLPGGNGWGDLAGAVIGIVLGGTASVIYTGVDTSVVAVRLHRLNVILKALGEQYLGRPGPKSAALYEMYLEKAGLSALSKELFFEKLVSADHAGKLCDGSMIKKHRIRMGSALKFQVADSKHFVRALVGE